MAVSKENKTEVWTKLSPALKEHGLYGSLSVRNGSCLVLTIFSGPIDFVGDFVDPDNDGHIQVNEYRIDQFKGQSLEVLKKIIPLMYVDGWYCNDDIMSDYFDRSYYISVNIGKWDRPYKLTSPKTSHKKSIAMNVYADKSNSEIAHEISAITTMVNQLEGIEVKHLDMTETFNSLFKLADEIENELKTRIEKFC